MTTTTVRKIETDRYTDIDKMDPEWKAKWLTALRSGEYTQGLASLLVYRGTRDAPKAAFCCLGVLCDLASREGTGAWDEEESGLGESIAFRGDYSDGLYAPTNVLELAGIGNCLDREGLRISSDVRSVQNIVANFNDDGYSFEEIANWIEENL